MVINVILILLETGAFRWDCNKVTDVREMKSYVQIVRSYMR